MTLNMLPLNWLIRFMEHSLLTKWLKPLWLLTFWIGILPDWCQPIAKGKLVKVASSVAVVISACFSVFCTCSQLFETIVAAKVAINFRAIIIPMFSSILAVSSCAYLLDFIYLSRKFVAFFKNWSLLDRQDNIGKYSLAYSKAAIRIFMTLNFAILISSFPAIGIAVNIFPDERFLMAFYSICRESLAISMITFLEVIKMVYFVVPIMLSDIVPTFTFYHGSLIVRGLTKQLENYSNMIAYNMAQTKVASTVNHLAHLDLEVQLKNIWSQYEVLRKLVGKANKLFGAILLVSHSAGFFAICSLTYAILSQVRTLELTSLALYIFILAYCIMRVVYPILMQDRLKQSFNQLKSTLTVFLSDHWLSLTDGERFIATTMLNRFQEGSLIASPLGLYNIERSLLLSFLSLTVSYIIILLQTP